MTSGQDSGSDPLLEDLRDLQKYAAQFQALVSTARDAAPPRASGHDSSGLAFAEVDGEGRPTTLRLEQGWDRSLEPEQLGAALLEAYQTATQEHLQAWGEDLRRQGWQYDTRDFDEKVRATPTPQEPLFRAPASVVGEPRSPQALLSAVIEELDISHAAANQPPAPARPAAQPASRVGVTLAHGTLESVHVDADWARGRDSATINGELAGALQTARLGETSEAGTAFRERSNHLDDLLGEVMKALQNHRREK